MGSAPCAPSLTQVLAVNAAAHRGHRARRDRRRRQPASATTGIERDRFLVLVAALLATVLAQRLRPAPPLRAAGAADRHDGARRPRRPRHPRAAIARRRVRRRSPACTQAFDAHARAPRGRARAAGDAVLRAQEAERARRRPRPARRGQPGARPACSLRLAATAQGAPAGAARGAARDAARRDAGDGRAAAAWRASCGPPRSTTTGSRRRCARRCETSGAAPACCRRCRGRRDAVDELGAYEQLVVYRVVQEALSNVARHAGARSVRVDGRARPTAARSCGSPTTATGFAPGTRRDGRSA